MCGIFSIISKKETIKITDILASFEEGRKRGPEENQIKQLKDTIIFGFHRLAINGVSDITSMQPFNINNCVLICNGEIYNWKKLYRQMNITPRTGSDCEVIIHCYNKYGITQTLQLLDGVFAFILFDKRNNNIFIARDSYGIRPLFISKDDNTYLFATMKDRSIYFFNLNDKNQIENKPQRINIGERIRDIAVLGNEYYMFLEDTGSIARFTIN